MSAALNALTSQWRDPNTNPINFVVINGHAVSPGIATVEGASDPRRWDERNAYGTGGSILFYTGFQQSHFSVKLRLYTPQDWADWEVFRKLFPKPVRVTTPDGLAPARRGDSGAFDIWHPFLAMVGIKAAVVEEILQPVLTDETGEWTVEIKMISFRNPKPQFAKPAAADAPPQPTEEEKIAADLADQNAAQVKRLLE